MLTTLISLFATTSLLGSSVTPSLTVIPKENAFLTVSSIPQRDPNLIAPIIKAKSAIAVDLKTGIVLYEKDSHKHLPVASLSKLMTAVVILENHKLDEEVIISRRAAQTEGSKAWLAQGEKITVENLLYALLIHSANDAAYALAEYDSENVKTFVNKMNQKAEEIGLYNTHFTNPIGLDENGNYSSAYDLTILGRYAFGKSFIKNASATKELEISSTNGGLTHKLKTTNDLLNSYLKVLGLKTGTTDLAGQCLISVIENNNGQNILTVVLDSPSRYQETKVLADWISRSFRWI